MSSMPPPLPLVPPPPNYREVAQQRQREIAPPAYPSPLLQTHQQQQYPSLRQCQYSETLIKKDSNQINAVILKLKPGFL